MGLSFAWGDEEPPSENLGSEELGGFALGLEGGEWNLSDLVSGNLVESLDILGGREEPPIDPYQPLPSNRVGLTSDYTTNGRDDSAESFGDVNDLDSRGVYLNRGLESLAGHFRVTR